MEQQRTFASLTGFEKYAKQTRRTKFLSQVDVVVPWEELWTVVEPFYPKTGGPGRPPVGVERMLRVYFLQPWFNSSDPMVKEALYDSLAMPSFVAVALGREPAPDETTVCTFCHTLEHGLWQAPA